MLFGTVFGVILIPGLYVVFETLSDRLSRKKKKEVAHLTHEVNA
jgi:HAE1 family hydrophobic/amphiphilic exporter-1